MSRTLKEAILHAEEVASDYENMMEKSYLDSEKLAKCANEQRQLAEWLKELKAVKDLIRQHDEDSMPEDFWYINKIREAVQE